jgi:transcriptional regulator with XRE-family HTH domain
MQMNDNRFIREFRERIAESNTNAYQVGMKAHGSRSTVYSWMNGSRSSPGVDNFEAALNVLGLTLKIVPLEEKQ